MNHWAAKTPSTTPFASWIDCTSSSCSTFLGSRWLCQSFNTLLLSTLVFPKDGPARSPFLPENAHACDGSAGLQLHLALRPDRAPPPEHEPLPCKPARPDNSAATPDSLARWQQARAGAGQGSHSRAAAGRCCPSITETPMSLRRAHTWRMKIDMY